MKKVMRKSVSALLACLMVLSCISAVSFAADPSVTVIKGPAGSYERILYTGTTTYDDIGKMWFNITLDEGWQEIKVADSVGTELFKATDASYIITWLDENLLLRQEADGGFSYRHSRFSDTKDVILAADIRLSPDSEETIRGRMRTLMEKRKTSQPLDLPSAGSTFKRPASGFAAAMIDEAGLKGFAIGGAQVSPKHAGFVVNTGSATCEDVRRLMAHIQETVYKNTGILLEPEVKMIDR